MARIFLYGDNVDTDVIIPARFLTKSDLLHLKEHCMEDIDPTFSKTVQPGDIIVARKNFGCGSSREHAPLALKASGIKAVIAVSFARIFFRNAVNIGLAIFECPDAVFDADERDELDVCFETGVIVNRTKNKTYQAVPMAEFQRDILLKGGLLNL